MLSAIIPFATLSLVDWFPINVPAIPFKKQCTRPQSAQVQQKNKNRIITTNNAYWTPFWREGRPLYFDLSRHNLIINRLYKINTTWICLHCLVYRQDSAPNGLLVINYKGFALLGRSETFNFILHLLSYKWALSIIPNPFAAVTRIKISEPASTKTPQTNMFFVHIHSHPFNYLLRSH